jgi:hypothetical protein
MSLPTSAEETSGKRDRPISDADTPDQNNESEINSAINRGEFSKARKIIDKVADPRQKSQWIELVNMREASYLAAKGETEAAVILARQLKAATSILRVYPAIINRCVIKKDHECARTSINDAMRQLKSADDNVVKANEGLQESLAFTKENYDPVVLSLSRLAEAIVPLDGSLALDVLEETVRASNASRLEVLDGRTGFEPSAFRKIAPVDETRVKEEAMMLTKPLEQIVALAGVSQWKAEQLTATPGVERKKLVAAPSTSSGRN